MSALENFKGKFKEFGPTTWAIKNKTSMYLLMVFITILGVIQFITLPKEQFPDVVIPYVFVQTVYVGNSPTDIENLVTKPIEKQIKSISGVKIANVKSTSQQDFSSILVEFDANVDPDIALRKVKDATDKAKQDLPTDLTQEPVVQDVNVSDRPIMYVNISGNYDVVKLKKFADDLKDAFEELPEINRVDVVGAAEREFQVHVDPYRMQSANITYDDIIGSLQRENMDISGGLLQVGNMQRNLQLKGQFKTVQDIEKVILRNTSGSSIYLKDIAVIRDTIKDRESFARLGGKNVVTLNIIKRSGENLLETSEKVKEVTNRLKTEEFPKDLNVVITGDSSRATKVSFNDLVNSIVIGFILVLIILMFFMGVTNAFFVALSVPLSMFVAFMFLPLADMIVGANVTLNFMVLFALLFGLGIIVDDAIVVIENTHRIFMDGNGLISSEKAARMAAGEIFVPVLSGTLTTLAPFVPLLFWPGIIGKFMIYLPTMLIFTLTASLIVAFLMNPVFAVDFMNHEDDEEVKRKSDLFRKPIFWVLIGVGILFDIIGLIANANEVAPLVETAREGLRPGGVWLFFGNLLLFFALIVVLGRYFIQDAIVHFQNRILPGLMNRYEKLLRWSLVGWRPVHLLLGAIGVLILSIGLFMVRKVPVVFFPNSDPNFVYVYLKLPVGTKVEYTDSITSVLEKKVMKVLDMENGKQNPIVESIISNVAIGANDPAANDMSTRTELGRVQVSFVEFEKRHGISTAPYLAKIREAVQGVPGAEISVAKESNGPPTEPPVNIEIAGEDLQALTSTASNLKNFLDSANIPGVEELKMDVDLSNPEVTLSVDRERAMMQGVSSAQIGMLIRTTLFGREASKIKEEDEEYKIQVRSLDNKNSSLSEILNKEIVFRDMATGAVKRVPVSSVVNFDLTNTLGSVKRKDFNRVISLRSNVLLTQGYTPTAVNQEIAKALSEFKGKPDDITIKQTGEGEQQAETGQFLFTALFIALILILFILVLQFNSISKAVIILTEVIFSVIGVMLGFALTKMEFSVVMSGMGIVGLAGIVVKNGILVIEFADELRSRGMKTREALVQAGKIRIIPVLLTALAAIMAFFPIAIGFNINFITLFAELNPRIFLGGDNAAFWKPLSWTIIFGLIVAFFMTLVVVPAMYLIAERLKRPMRRHYGGKWVSMMGVPPLTILFIPMVIYSMIRHNIDVRRRKRRLPDEPIEHNGSWF